MKYIFSFIITTLLAFSCAAPNEKSNNNDLASLKAELSIKKSELRSIEKEIDSLELKIEALEPSKEKAKKAVTTFNLQEETFESYTELQGNLESSEAVMISAEMGGRITSLSINEGDYVNKGQVVGTVDMEQLKKSISEIETSLELATDVYERQKRLWDQKIGSEIQYLQAKNNKERLEKSLETIQTQLSKENIVSPMSGYVDRKFLNAGEMTAPGSPIASVINTGTVKAIIDVPENLVTAVKRGDQVTVSFPALGTERKARISKIGRTIDPANRTFKIEINLSNPGNKLKPNLLTLTKINDKTIKDVLMLPIELVQQDVSGNSFVYTVAEGESGTYAQKNIVQTGESYDGKIIIEEGLSSGDEIINVGARGLASNDLLEIKNDSK